MIKHFLEDAGDIQPVTIEGTTQTIPSLAPSIIEILRASAAGEPLPLIGKPQYDESEAAGEERASRPREVNDVDFEAVEAAEEQRSESTSPRTHKAVESPENEPTQGGEAEGEPSAE